MIAVYWFFPFFFLGHVFSLLSTRSRSNSMWARASNDPAHAMTTNNEIWSLLNQIFKYITIYRTLALEHIVRFWWWRTYVELSLAYRSLLVQPTLNETFHRATMGNTENRLVMKYENDWTSLDGVCVCVRAQPHHSSHSFSHISHLLLFIVRMAEHEWPTTDSTATTMAAMPSMAVKTMGIFSHFSFLFFFYNISQMTFLSAKIF